MNSVDIWVLAWCDGRYVHSEVFVDEAIMLRYYIDLGNVAKSYQRVRVKGVRQGGTDA